MEHLADKEIEAMKHSMLHCIAPLLNHVNAFGAQHWDLLSNQA
jgi:hypothetical protein